MQTVTQMKEKEKTVKEHPAAELLTIDIFRRLSKAFKVQNSTGER